MAREPVEDLDQLELIVKIVLEPKYHFIRFSKPGQHAIAPLQAGKRFGFGPVAQLCKESRSNRPHLVERKPRRNRTLVQHVLPGKDLPAQAVSRNETESPFVTCKVCAMTEPGLLPGII